MSARAILYDRVSTRVQSLAGYSGGAAGYQLSDCRARATARGYVVVGEITDVDSGADWQIAGIMDALDRARRSEYDVLIVPETSRFARNLAKKTVYEADLRRHGVVVEYLNLPDTDTIEGRFLSNVFGAVDELERERISHRTAKGRHQKAQAGKVVGAGPPPYGYRYVTERDDARHRDVPVGLAPDPSGAVIVARIFRERLAMSPGAIADRLTAEGVPTPASWTPSATRPLPTAWCPQTIRRIIGNATYRGAWSYGATVVAVPSLVEELAWQAAQRADELPGRIGKPRQRRADRDPERTASWVLRGRLVCGDCGGAISTDDRQISGAAAAGWPRGRMRRYLCARAMPSWARRDGKAVCCLPGLLAADERLRSGGRPLVGIEDLAWAFVVDLHRTPGRFESIVAAFETQTAEQRARWEAGRTALDTEIAVQERRARRAREEKADYERETDGYREYAEREQAAEQVLRRLRPERDAYVAAGGPGLAPEHRAALVAHSTYVRDLIRQHVDGPRQPPVEYVAGVYAALRLTGRVRRDSEGGLAVGRDGRVSIEWQVLVTNGTGLLKLVLLATSSGVAPVALVPATDAA